MGLAWKVSLQTLSALWVVLKPFLAVEVEALTKKIHMTSDQADGICFLLWITMPYSGMTYNGIHRKKSHSFHRSGMKMKNWSSLGTPFRRNKEKRNSQRRLALYLSFSTAMLLGLILAFKFGICNCPFFFNWNSVCKANTETSCYCQGACNCKTFAQVKTDTILLNTYLKHPVTREIIVVQFHKKYAGKELYIIRQISYVLEMDLKTWRILVDGQAVRSCSSFSHFRCAVFSRWDNYNKKH